MNFPGRRKAGATTRRTVAVSLDRDATPAAPTTRRHVPAWAPLRSPLFRALWFASLASNIGSWMHDMSAAWLMTSLTPDPQMNALVQTAGAFPLFLLALPSGALADIVDRRKLIICTQTWMFFMAGVLAVLTLLRFTSPWTLLIFTLLMAMGNAMTGPAWQAIIPEIVKKRQLASAMSLGGIAFNLSRVLGPALGGVVIHIAMNYMDGKRAPGVVFGVNALSFLAVVLVMVRWDRPNRESDLPPEHVPGAMRAGLRYLRHSPELRAVLTRVGGFMTCGCVMWSLLPLYAAHVLKLDASGYGSMLGFFGASAVVMGASFAALRRRFSSDELVHYSWSGAIVALVVLAWLPEHAAGFLVTAGSRLAMFVAGLSWCCVLLSCNVVIMRTVPDWVRSRASSMFLLVMMGSSALGSIFWGAVAKFTDIPVAFALGAAGLTLGMVFLKRFAIVDPDGTSLEPSQHWPEPGLAFEPRSEAGPVLVTAEYDIEPGEAAAFLQAIQGVRRIRLRDGALRWNIFQDAQEPRRWVETMLVESWNEYLRQYARVTLADQEVETAAHAFHRGAEPPRINHLIAGHASRWSEEADDDNGDDNQEAPDDQDDEDATLENGEDALEELGETEIGRHLGPAAAS